MARTNAALALEQATMLAPASGTLTAFPFVAGEQASTDDVATVRTLDAKAISVDIAQATIASVKAGQEVAVTSTTGSHSVGVVSRVGLLASSTSGTATWPVSITVASPDGSLASGTTAGVVITIAEASQATLVPVSAVTLTSTTRGTVTVIDGGSTTTKDVTLGIRGATHLQITDGLSVGQKVKLADLGVALPTSSSTSSTRTGGSQTSGLSGLSGSAGGQMPGGTPPR